MEILHTLEAHYKDMQDTEFTVEEGHLYMLQTRNAKRPAQAAVRFAVDAVKRGSAYARGRRCARSMPIAGCAASPNVRPWRGLQVLAHGVAASPGAAAGAIVFSAPEAVAAAADGKDVILVRPFTEADDVAGFHAAKGILTSEGGKASHAALVARGMGVPAVTGARSRSTARRKSYGSTAGFSARAMRSASMAPTAPSSSRARAWSSRPSTSASVRSWPGPTSCVGSGSAPTPTRRTTPRGDASSAPRALVYAEPSTCSWPRTGRPRCGP